MPVRTTIIYEYHCEQCGCVDTVRYEVGNNIPLPKPFVKTAGTQGETFSPGSSYFKTESGRVLCVACKSGIQ